MLTSQFDYHLPEELIAQHPVEPRDASRLLVVHRDTGELEHRTEQARRQNGIPVPANLLEELHTLAAELKVSPLLDG